jgi:hypothetical protein
MPQVMHGPRVDEGTSALINAGIGKNIPVHRDESFLEDGPHFVPSLYVGGRVGNAHTFGSTAFSLGVQIPAWAVFLITDAGDEALSTLGAVTYADLYVQPKRAASAGVDYGAGVLASTVVFNPYVQYGRTRADGHSWYTTQGFMVTHTGSDESLTMYVPSVSWRTPSKSGTGAVSLNVGAAVGRLNDRTEWLALLSVTAELGLKPDK